MRGLGFGFGFNRARRGVALPLVAQLAASPACLAVYDWTDPGSMTAGAGGPVSNGSAIAVVPNVKSPGTLNLAQSTAAARPVYNNGPVFDGSDDWMATAWAAGAGPANGTWVYALRTADTQFMLAGANSASARFAGAAESGVGTAAQSGTTANYFANGSALGTTRAALFTGWGTNAAVVARVANANFQDALITSVGNSFAGNTGFFFTGKCCLVAILNASDPGYAAALALAEAEAARIITALAL